MESMAGGVGDVESEGVRYAIVTCGKLSYVGVTCGCRVARDLGSAPGNADARFLPYVGRRE